MFGLYGITAQIIPKSVATDLNRLFTLLGNNLERSQNEYFDVIKARMCRRNFGRIIPYPRSFRPGRVSSNVK